MQGGTLSSLVLLLVIMGGATHAQVLELETTPSPDTGLTEAPPCNSSRDCLSCSDIPGCGWCDVTQECMTGTEFGANDIICPSWFYYGCFSVGDTASCSDHIADLSCDLTHCDETKTNYNADVCEHCRSVEACFDQDTAFCPSLNEAKCPDGLPAKNDSIPHKNVVQIGENVKAVDPTETTLYNCPVRFPADFGEGAALLVAPTPTDLQVGDIVVSAQAGGIMHNVDNITPYGPYAFVMASAAKLEDVVTYASFDDEVNAVSFEDEEMAEHKPDPSLLYSALNGELQNYPTFLVFPEDVSIHKCIGAKYISGDGNEWTSTFFVMKKTDFNVFFVNEEDVIVGNYSQGWLETVTDISSIEDPEFTYVETKLQTCAEMLPDSNRLKLEDPSQSANTLPNLHCPGGDNTAGLLVYKDMSTEDLNYQIGDTIVGRKGGPFMSKVMTWTEVGEFVFIEASPMSDLDGTSTMNSTRLTRRRRVVFNHDIPVFSLRERYTKTIIGSGTSPGGVKVEGTATITVEPYLYLAVGLRVKLSLGWTSPPLHRAEATFTGTVGVGLFAKATISVGISKTWTALLKDGVIATVCIPIIPAIPALCIPGKLKYAINAEVTVDAQITAEVKVGAEATAKAVTFGVKWQHGVGVTPIFKNDLEFKEVYGASAKVKGKAGIKATITPSITLDLPSIGLTIDIPRFLRWAVPDWLLEATSTKRSKFTLFSPTISLPVIGEVKAEFCPALKSIEYLYGLPAMEGNVEIGITGYTVNLPWTLHLGFTDGDKIEYPENCSEVTATLSPSTTIHVNNNDTTMTPYDTPTRPYVTTTTPYGTTTTPYDIATTPYDTTTTSTSFDTPCIVDLVFLIDGSSKIGRARFEEAKLYIRNVVECLNLTETDVGVIQFHCESKWEITLGEYTDNVQLQNAIMADVIFEGGTPSRVGLALRHMKATTPFRDNAHQVAVVLTDGRFGGAYVGRAQEARDAGIEIYGVAVGRTAFIQMSGLNAITGNPGRVVHWKLVEPCMFAALLCNVSG